MKEHAKVRRLDTPLVWPCKAGEKQPVKPMNLRIPWEAAVKRAGLTDFRFHDLRHSAASYLAMNSASPVEIAAILGHRTLQMVKRYAHVANSHTSSVVRAMNDKIFQARA